MSLLRFSNAANWSSFISFSTSLEFAVRSLLLIGDNLSEQAAIPHWKPTQVEDKDEKQEVSSL